MRNLQRALFICSQIPLANADQAGNKTAYQYLFDLSKDYIVDLIIICKSNDKPSDLNIYKSLGQFIHKIEIVRLSNIERFISIIFGFFLGISPRFSTRISINLALKLYKINRMNCYSKVWLEFSQSFWASFCLGKSEQIVMSAHDLQTQVVLRKGLIESIFLLGWTYISEIRLLSKSTLIRVQSSKDAQFLRDVLQTNHAVEVSSPVLSKFLHSIERVDSKVSPYSMLFWGAMNREENFKGVVNFINHYFPSIKNKFPNSKLYIVGANPAQEIFEVAKNWKESIIVTGFIENPSKYFEECSVGIVPLTSGAGIKVKVLEMLEAKMPVISTPIGSEGVGENLLLHTVPLELFENELQKLWSKYDA